MLNWIWRNKEWIFQGIGSMAFLQLLPFLIVWITRLGRQVWRSAAAWRAQVRTLIASSGERARTLPWASSVIVCLLVLLVMIVGPQTYRGVQSAPEGPRSTSSQPSLRLVDRAGLPLALTWVSVTRHGVAVCEGRTTSSGELSCAELAGRYLITSQVMGLPVTIDVEIAGRATSVWLPLSLAGM